MTNGAIKQWTGIVAGALILAVGWLGVLRWTLIPLAIDARIDDTSYEGRTAGHFRVLYLSNGSELVVDQEFFERAEVQLHHGSTITKAAWESDVVLAGRSVPLRIATDVWRTMVALAVPVGIGWWLRRRRSRRTLSQTSPDT
ncbi:MAG: hypothetical protein KDC23_12845 [Actinobacteria bacterium]|nr:hypothetical protein [Actinomycetota bacterium]